MYAIRDLFNLLDDALDTMKRMEQEAEAAAQRFITSHNQAKTVRVTMGTGAVQSVEFDREWLRAATHERIAAALEEALAQACRAANEEQQRKRKATPEIERLRQLTASPELLLREVGLIR
ncbi:YbaB/EbfC family nucleoid-associated protein [Salinispora pacifica]|uniref:YbaB/EbfC family nucleoid-associated protein n=1 Tax=Salinispora pacifica TaxID=351187 RepID=UPI00036C4838|nr:YbaB/EbfC family nucleoid-associated protein [Salinispora pacifica]